MKKDIRKTFINPIVLPDYPVLPARGNRLQPDEDGQAAMRRMDASYAWGRNGKPLVSIDDMMEEDGHPSTMGDIGEVLNFAYGKAAQNDVRATADPSAYYFNGKWYLYITSGAVYESENLVDWTVHHEESWMPISAPMAPTVEEYHGKYYGAANNTPLFVSDNPVGPWTQVGDWTLPDGREFVAGDVMLFRDDDDRLYLYFGLGPAILGAELDPEQPNRLITKPKVLIPFIKENYWERYGGNNENWGLGFIEGSWMVKHGEKYYLVYSCAGTEFYAYAMGAYVADSPLGDFHQQARNPVSRNRDKGLCKGGGHGSFVKGPNDSLWIFYTIPVCVDATMERRIGMDPAGFDEEGNLFALTGIDVPQWSPGVVERPELGNATELVPLTVFKTTQASSWADGHYPMYAIDEALHTWWQPSAEDKEPSLAVCLGGRFHVSAFRVMWKDIGMDLNHGVLGGAYQYVIETSRDSKDWTVVADFSHNETDLSVAYHPIDTVEACFARIRILGAPEGITPGLLNFTVFGESVHKTNIQFKTEG